MEHNDLIAEMMAAEGVGGTLFYDTFTDTGTVALQDHTPEIGDPWNISSGAFDVAGGVTYSTAASGPSYAVGNQSTGESNVYIEALLTHFSGFIFRQEGSSNYYLATVSQSGTNHFMEVYKNVAGSFTLLKQILGSWPTTSHDLVQIQAFGTEIKMRSSNPANQSEFVTGIFTDATYSSGVHGVYGQFTTSDKNIDEILCRTTDGTDL